MGLMGLIYTCLEYVRGGSIGIGGATLFIFTLLNLKVLPFVWHLTELGLPSQFRLIKAFLDGAFLKRGKKSGTAAPEKGPSDLFQPVKITSRAPLLECDYNLHKSNSTYFADLDISRSQLLFSLLRKGIFRTRSPAEEKEDWRILQSVQTDEARSRSGGKGAEASRKQRLSVIMGGITCNFKREIKPYQRYEVWTRILCWDRKWLYMLSHFVDAEKLKKEAQRRADSSHNVGPAEKLHSSSHPAIFASSLSKYVFKRGRLTIPPDRALQASTLLPEDWEYVGSSPTSLPDKAKAARSEADAAIATNSPIDESVDLDEQSLEPAPSDRPWDKQRIEQECIRGLKIAAYMEGLESLHAEFDSYDS
ncbi:hypothetical protein MMC25_000911 [Agyrium rufum]|nr:hypothetical protein [Agyrium rufum]